MGQSHSLPLAGEIALVTGASRGIGRAIAQLIAQRGAFVIGTATSEQGVSAIDAQFDEAGLSGRGLCLDVTDREFVEQQIKALQNEHGAPSILVNNAGITRDNLLLRMTDRDWNAIIETNLTSVYRLSKLLVRPMLKKRYGRIVNIASVAGVMGNAGQSNYAAAKAGIIGFSKALAREVGARGITVNVVAPGFIDTDMTRALPEQQRSELAGSIPLNRLGDPQDIAHAVAFLVSREAGYVTGETLHVNGGLYMS